MTVDSDGDALADLFGEAGEQPLERTSVAEQTVAAIKDMIISGELEAGQTLPPERQLAQLLDISRPTLRQAIGALSAMNIVESRHGGGTYVTALTPALLTEPISFLLRIDDSAAGSLFEVRRILEVSAAALAAERIEEDALADLTRLLDVAAGTVGNRDRFLATSKRFHELVVKAVGNDLYAAMYRSIARLSEPAGRAGASSAAARNRAQREHSHIVQALRDRDAAAATEAMRAHLDALAPRAAAGRRGRSAPRS